MVNIAPTWLDFGPQDRPDLVLFSPPWEHRASPMGGPGPLDPLPGPPGSLPALVPVIRGGVGDCSPSSASLAAPELQNCFPGVMVCHGQSWLVMAGHGRSWLVMAGRFCGLMVAISGALRGP